MDKDNQFRSCSFYLATDDVVHIRVKDLTGVGFSVELSDADGTAEDETEVIPYVAIESIRYGALYNWYAAYDAREITSVGWHVPTRAEFYDLMRYVDNDGLQLSNTAGTELKDTDYWELPNSATNSYGFNMRGAGIRSALGSFNNLLRMAWCHTTTELTSDPTYTHKAVFYSSFYGLPLYSCLNIGSNDDSPDDNSVKILGVSIRPIKDSTALSHGESGSYTGNDGKVYRTICIGTQEWLADNLAETKYRDGSDIPIVTDNSAWAALATGAMCYYNNDISYA